MAQGNLVLKIVLQDPELFDITLEEYVERVERGELCPEEALENLYALAFGMMNIEETKS